MPTQDTDLQAVQLAALLHDVGKLYQRAGLRPAASYDAFTTKDFGAHGAHAKWSADFVERHVAGRWPVRPHDILTHHLSVPPSRVAKLVALADRMASGERESEEGGDSRPPWEAQMLSIFSRLEPEQGQASRDGYYPLAPLELTRGVLFPKTERLSTAACRDGYLRLWRGFESEFALLRQEGFEGFLEGIYHLLQRFCWCVPSAAYHQRPDVSLFDHARLTCGIAACLQLDGLDDAQIQAQLAWPPIEAERRKPLLLLVGGDISGLQDFLYTVAAGGAAKTLRGRSFYLQLLAESAARFLLRRLGLSTPNIVYSGGGHFYLLAPISAESLFETLISELEQSMLDLHHGDLGLAIGCVRLSADDFQGEQFARKWGEVGSRIGEAKGRRFGRVLRRSYGSLFAPSGAGGAGARCDACRAEVVAPRHEEPRCPVCKGMEELGDRLARVASPGGDLLSLAFDRPGRGGARWQEDLWNGFRTWWEFGALPGEALRYTLNETNFAAAGAHGFRWVPVVVPWEGRPGQGGVKDFNEIARDSVGIERLGILRMDMDDLGALFAKRLGSGATASRVASLSSALRLFFEGWINQLCREVESDRELVPDGVGPRSGLLYGVYSGGDDLFIVGAWDRMPVLARRVRADLASFAVENPAVRISAGISLVDAHLPVYQAASQAREALERGSKEYRRGGRTKDAVTFLGETLGWEEWDPLCAQVAELVGLVGSGREGAKVPRGLLSLLGTLHEMYRREVRQQTGGGPADPERLYYGRWMWMAAYGLGRARERARAPEARSALAALQKRLTAPEAILRLGLVARWAEFLTRSREVEKR